MAKSIKPFLDENGKIKQIPTKQSTRDLVYAYLAEKFALDFEYSESEVNSIVDQWHTFNDYFVLRRGLVDSGWLKRLPDGSKYWKNQDKDEAIGAGARINTEICDLPS